MFIGMYKWYEYDLFEVNICQVILNFFGYGCNNIRCYWELLGLYVRYVRGQQCTPVTRQLIQ